MWPCDLDLWPWKSWHLWLMRSSSSMCLPSLKFEALPFGRHVARCVWALMSLMTLTFDLLILKLVCELHQRWGTFLPNLGTLGLWVFELFAMYAMDRQTDGRTDGQSNAYCPLLYGRGHNNRHFTHEYSTGRIVIWCWSQPVSDRWMSCLLGNYLFSILCTFLPRAAYA